MTDKSKIERVLDVLEQHGPMTSAQVAYKAKISRGTAFSAISRLKDAGHIEIHGQVKYNGVPKALLYRFASRPLPVEDKPTVPGARVVRLTDVRHNQSGMTHKAYGGYSSILGAA